MNCGNHGKETDSFDVFVRRADDVLREMGKSPAVRHLRLAGAELLRAVRCGLDSAISVVEPAHREKPDADAPPPTQ